MNDKLFNEIKSLGKFTDEDIELFFSFLEESFIEKGDHFLNVGQISHYVAYITSGLTMHYEVHDGIEIPGDFQLRTNGWEPLKILGTQSPQIVLLKHLKILRY